ncbi:hypothetical protein ES703_113475 [subsurface metagenome]
MVFVGNVGKAQGGLTGPQPPDDEEAVYIGCGTCSGTFHDDVHADNGLAGLGVGHVAGDVGSLQGGGCKEGQSGENHLHGKTTPTVSKRPVS